MDVYTLSATVAAKSEGIDGELGGALGLVALFAIIMFLSGKHKN